MTTGQILEWSDPPDEPVAPNDWRQQLKDHPMTWAKLEDGINSSLAAAM
jgi:hypothetical protein